MKRYFALGGIVICLDSERPLRQEPSMGLFYAEEQPPDISVHITWDWKNALCPKTSPVGEDLIQIYYREPEWNFCELAGGDRGALARTWYKSDFSQMELAINNVTCHVPQDREGQILRMLPMREIFLHFGTLFLHASQIAYNGKGILFAAPSGTGKTTQARLWQEFCGAEIICNDRTLLRKHGGVWHTYGYPLDGSEPVRSGAVNRLGCVVLLEQGKENRVQRLSPGKAVGPLMRQAVMDCWSAEAREGVMNLLFSLLEDVPVFLLSCTPDQHAVEVLKGKLEEEEVIVNG